MGRYKIWTLNWTIDWISYGLNFGLDFDSRMYEVTSCFTTFQALPLSTFFDCFQSCAKAWDYTEQSFNTDVGV